MFNTEGEQVVIWRHHYGKAIIGVRNHNYTAHNVLRHVCTCNSESKVLLSYCLVSYTNQKTKTNPSVSSNDTITSTCPTQLYAVTFRTQKYFYMDVTKQDGEAVALRICILEMFGSNMSQDTGHPDVFAWLPVILSGKCRDSTWIRPQPQPSEYF
jgi:hypothetical protein